MSQTSQNDIILNLLQNQANAWVPMPDLAAAAGCYAVHSRVANLRQRGHRVENKVEASKESKSKRLSFYRLLLNCEL